MRFGWAQRSDRLVSAHKWFNLAAMRGNADATACAARSPTRCRRPRSPKRSAPPAPGSRPLERPDIGRSLAGVPGSWQTLAAFVDANFGSRHWFPASFRLLDRHAPDRYGFSAPERWPSG
jgi:hypothetical protein